MNTLRKLSLKAHELKTIPAFYYNGRIVSVKLLRQYTNTPQENGNSSESSKLVKVSTPLIFEESELYIPLIPEEPKKPPTAFILFYRDFLNRFREDCSKLMVTEIAKSAGAGWAKLTQEEKNEYKNRHKQLYSEYKKRHDIWLSSLTPRDIIQENKRRKLMFKNDLASEKKKKKLRLIKDPNFPTPPKTPYIYFAMKRMDEGSGRIGLDKLEELVFDWKRLTFEDKKPYVKEYNEEKLRYEEQMEEYRKMESSL
ncbi:hypothetical protein RclHR1_01470023 [Rhizophagus clarus]|uniref:HMG1, putative n=1 Tax=Rhizophagus clarus TaxID=94130 RepID=A0A2Z6QF60_9GLOM|nr:hypothetical protein RclHR1_01470023 [Rhizophagus clarus]GES84231.1 HMG1, putative [Rhizophagus clarus]